MTSYNTGNPIGSKDPRDLYDNAENLDELVNSKSKLRHPDRLGVQRKTWHAIEEQVAQQESEFNADQARRENEHDADQTRRESEFVDAQADKQQRFNLLLANSGYEYLADYAAGIEITEYNQVLRDTAGELWRAAATTTLPYTTDGTGLPEGGAFVAVGDADIRNDLAAGVGAGKGGLLVAGAVIYVDTIADLRALDKDLLVDGQIVHVRSAGEFSWDSTKERFRYTDAGKKAKMVGYHENPKILSLPSPLSRVIGEVDGNLYARGEGDIIYESTDLGKSWQEVHNFTAASLSSEGASLHPTNDGEVLINTVTTLFKSSGWSADPSTATFTQVLQVNDPASGRFYRGWGFSVVDSYVMVSEYGVPKPGGFKSYLSTDNGSTFTEVFDLRDHEAGDSNAHNHGCCIDPWHNYRLWQLTADSGNIGTHYSDDLGATWTRMPDEAHHIGSIIAPTSMIATEQGILLGSDGAPNGVWRIPRDDNYATAPTMQVIYELRTGHTGGTHIGFKHIRVDGIVYTGFAKEWNDYPSVVTATDVESGETWTVWDNAPTGSFRLPSGGGTADLHNIFYAQDTLIIQLAGSFDLVMCPVYEASAPRTNTLELVDTGHVLGGTSNPDQEAVSVGMLAYAGGLASTAVGTRAEASNSRSIAVGTDSSALGYESIAIGYSSASAVGNYGLAIGVGATSNGSRSIVIGQNASTSETGGNSFVAGRAASSISSESVVIGRNATSSDGNEAIVIGLSANGGNRAIAIGSEADAHGVANAIAIGRRAGAAVNYGIAIGGDAQVTGNSGMAIGRDAKAPYSNSVAIGNDAVTTHIQQLKFPEGYHIELGNGANPDTPAANNIRIYVRDNNGVQQLMVGFGNGVFKVLADDTTE